MTERRFHAIAWDIDGTLVDSEPLHHRSLVGACQAFGLDLSRRPDSAFVGLHLGDIWTVLRPELPAGLSEARWRDEIRGRYLTAAPGLHEIAGARAAIRQIAAMGLRQIAVSNSARAVVDANLEALGVGAMLEGSVSFDDVSRGKPDPEPYRKGVALLGLAPGQVLAVEDSAPGARSALAAGLAVAGLGAAGDLDGVRSLSRLADLIGVLGTGSD